MASNYPGSNFFHPQISIPSDGDPAVSESVNTALRSIQDDAIHFNTELANKIDARGGTYTLAASVTINGTHAFSIQPSTVVLGNPVNGTVSVIADDTSIGGDTLEVEATNTYLVSPNTFVGSSTSQEFAVYANADFYGPVALHNDLVAGHNVSVSTLDVDGGADFNCNVQLTHASQTVTVGGNAIVQNGLVVTGGVTKTRSAQIGQSSTDFIQLNGDVQANNDVSIGGDLTVEGAIVGNASSGNSLGSTTIGGALSVLGDTTIGNSSSDSVTIKALLSGSLGMGSNGRILTSPGLISTPGTTSLSLGSPRFITVLGGASNITLTIDDTGMLAGDQFFISYSQGTASLTVNVGGTSISTGAISSSTIILATRFSGSGPTNWGLTGWARTI
jgi:hypothetical protein